MENHEKQKTFFEGMPPKTAFLFGIVSAVAALSLIVLLVLIPTKLKGSTKTTGTDTNTAAAPATNTSGAAANVDIKNVKTDGNPYIGDAKAPVTLAFWTDYQCPFCKQFDTATLPSLITNYVNKGKLKVVFKDFSFLGNDSTTAALAARAVWEVAPSKFLDWHEAMYNKQDEENSGWGSKDDIIALTKTISGIDADKVSKLMDSKKTTYQAAIDADRAEGTSFGVNGTPGFIIGKQLIAGAQPASDFTTAIDALLAAK